MGLWPVWPLAWVALVPLWLVSYRGGTPRQAALGGLLWGLGYQGTLLTWVLHLHPLMWLGVPWVGSIAIATAAYVIVTLWGACIPMAWALLMVLLKRRLSPLRSGQFGHTFGYIIIGTTLWCTLEALASLSPIYGTSLAITQSPDNLVVLHLARLSGYLTITAAIVAVNGLMAAGLFSWLQTRFQARLDEVPIGSLGPQPWLAAALSLLCVIHLIGWSLYQQPLADKDSEAIRVGIIQGNIPTREKLTQAGIRQARDRYLSSYKQLAEAGADAVLTPEGAIPEIWRHRLRDNNLFYRAVQTTKIPLWLGTFVIAPTEEFHMYQSLIALLPESLKSTPQQTETRAINQYNKIKLVPLGEYIPLQSLLGGLIRRLSPLDTTMIPGAAQQPQFESGVGPAAVGICYDSAYGWIVRRQVAQGGQFILTASNNDPYPPRMMGQHHGHDVIQAIATDRWAARSTNTGLSAAVNPHGQTQWISEPKTYDAQVKTIYRRDTITPYVRWGNWLLPLLIVSSIGWLVSSFKP
ncbi:apolipoprotein N-acyltransferase [Leptolyngbya ectocarpi]|nr:apolipoprotein N-acyltransferase [Leptolyngbya ectocarpi]